MSMWGGGTPPPKPPASTPPPSVTSYQNQRQQDELEALRRRGLAKSLNKHFTVVAQEISKERAATEAALRDLEQRKAKTSEFVQSTGGFSAYDEKYMQLQARKDDVKRKERETLLLYQRYVDKFGDTGAVAVPKTARKKLSSPSGKYPHAKPNKAVISKSSSSSNNNGKSGSADTKLTTIQDNGYTSTTPMAPTSPAKASQKAKASSNKQASSPSDKSPAKNDAVSTSDASMTNFTLPTENDSTVMGEEDDDRSSVSGLTSIHSTTIAAEIEEFLAEETKAIRQMMEDEHDSKSVQSGVTGNASTYSTGATSNDASTKATAKAEDMVRKMQKMIAEFDKKHTVEAKNMMTNHEPYELKTANPEEKWMVLWAETQGREYYHEQNSGKVQWDKPDVHAKPGEWTRVVDFSKEDHYMPSDFGTSGLRRSMSRRDQYRMIQKRKRTRRRITALVIAAILIGLGAYAYDRYQHNASFAAQMDDILHSILPSSVREQLLESTTRAKQQSQAEELVKKKEMYKVNKARKEAVQKEREVKEQKLREAKAEAERKQREQAEAEQKQQVQAEAEQRHREQMEAERRQREKEEAERKQREQAELKQKRKEQAEAERKLKELEETERKRKEKQEAERRQLQLEREALQKVKEEEARRQAEISERKIQEERRRITDLEKELLATKQMMELIRPSHCNLPLAYLFNGRCRKLSTVNPIFDLKGLTDSMMQ